MIDREGNYLSIDQEREAKKSKRTIGRDHILLPVAVHLKAVLVDPRQGKDRKTERKSQSKIKKSELIQTMINPH